MEKTGSIIKKLFDQTTGTIFVTGCNGVLTKRVAARLLQAGYPKVRLGVHLHSESEATAAEEFNKQGAELADFSWDREDTFEKALQGVHTVFCSTPHTEDFPSQFKAFLDACKRAHVQHMVKVSFYHKTWLGDMAHIPAEFRATVQSIPLVQKHAECDEALAKSGIHYTVLGASHLMSNLMMDQGMSLRKETSPVRFYGASCGKGVNYVSPNDIAEVATRVLLSPREHNGMEYSLTGPSAIKDSEVATLLSKHLGKEVQYINQTLKEFEEGEQFSGNPAWLVTDLVGLEGIKATGSEDVVGYVSNDIEKLCGHRAETFEEYLMNTVFMTPKEMA